MGSIRLSAKRPVFGDLRVPGQGRPRRVRQSRSRADQSFLYLIERFTHMQRELIVPE